MLQIRLIFLIGMLLSAGCTPRLIGDLNAGGGLGTLRYTYGVAAYVLSNATPQNSPTLSSGTATSYSITPPLPTGMSINSTTGVISGTPTSTTPAAATPDYTDYTVTANTGAGSVSTTIKLLVMSGYIVNDTANTNTAGNQTSCSTGAAGCTIRAAVQVANTAGGQRLIYVNDGTYTTTVSLSLGTGGTLTDLVFCGQSQAGTIVSGGGTVRAIGVISNDPDVLFCNMTVQNGSDSSGNGGGAISIDNTLGGSQRYDFRYMSFLNNTSTSFGGAMMIYTGTGSTTTLDHVLFQGNTASGGAQGGGGLLVSQGTVSMTQTSFRSNAASGASGAGGGVLLFNSASLTCNGCLFDSNTVPATGSGGGISVANTSNLTLVNSTLISNSGGGGGGIDFAGTGTSVITFSTFRNNTASAAGQHGGGILMSNASTLTTTANLFEGNIWNGTPEHCYRNAGTWSSGGYNLFASAGGTCATAAGPGDTSAASTGVASTLALNSGETENLSITATSGAYNLVPLATCSSNVIDIRRFVRPAGGACDAGAFEIQ